MGWDGIGSDRIGPDRMGIVSVIVRERDWKARLLRCRVVDGFGWDGV